MQQIKDIYLNNETEWGKEIMIYNLIQG